LCAIRQGSIPGVNIAHNTASRGYQGGKLVDDFPPVSRPLNIAHNVLLQVFARMGLLPQYQDGRPALLDYHAGSKRLASASFHALNHLEIVIFILHQADHIATKSLIRIHTP
jgi:hypothetical protein